MADLNLNKKKKNVDKTAKDDVKEMIDKVGGFPVILAVLFVIQGIRVSNIYMFGIGCMCGFVAYSKYKAKKEEAKE